MAGRLAVWVLAGAMCSTLLPGSSPTTPAPEAGEMTAAASTDNQCWKYKPSERGFARRMNEERTSRSLGKLSIDPEISKVARVHTNEMVRRNELYHTSSTDLRNRVTAWVVLGENVGVGGTVSSLHDAFMNSQAHRDNVLHSAYRNVGVGVRKANDRMWVTVIFEAVTDPGTTLSMPRC